MIIKAAVDIWLWNKNKKERQKADVKDSIKIITVMVSWPAHLPGGHEIKTKTTTTTTDTTDMTTKTTTSTLCLRKNAPTLKRYGSKL